MYGCFLHIHPQLKGSARSETWAHFYPEFKKAWTYKTHFLKVYIDHVEDTKYKENGKLDPELVLQQLGCWAEQEQVWITTSVPRLVCAFYIRQSLNKINLGAVPGLVHTQTVAELGPRSFPQMCLSVFPCKKKVEFPPIVSVTFFLQQHLKQHK